MYIHGSFLTRLNQEVEVHILTGGDRSEEVEIGADGSGLFFTDDPVEVQSGVNDSFDVLLTSSATVRLQSDRYRPELFTGDIFGGVVNIIRDGECIFAGYIQPQTYSQEFNAAYDDLEINCVDALSALQYIKFKDVDMVGTDFNAVLSGAGQTTFAALLSNIFWRMTRSLDITGTHRPACYYDQSKAASATTRPWQVFSQMQVPESMLLGDDSDATWTLEDILSEMLRFLNLHIAQHGSQFYIFSWETLRGGRSWEWGTVLNGTSHRQQPKTVEITADIAADTSARISIGEVYNQLELTCNTTENDEVLESPLDSSALTSDFSNRQLYMTELSAGGEGKTAYEAFYHLCRGEEELTTYGAGKITDWYVQQRTHPHWVFPGTPVITDDTHQERLFNRVGEQPAAMLLSVGKAERDVNKKDNSITARLNMEDCLVIGVHGNGKDDENQCYPTEASLLKATPVAVYTGPSGGTALSPADKATTNYIVFSGKITLNPLMKTTAPWSELAQWPQKDPITGHIPRDFWQKTVDDRNNEDGRYYCRRYYTAETPLSETVVDTPRTAGFLPFTDEGPQWYEFKYSAVGDSTDQISKVAVLACMLVVGDKCLVEILSGNGSTKDFRWLPYRERAACASDEEYYAQSFTLGFDPKIGDKIVGTQFNIQNNIHFSMGIDAEGTAIPVRSDDRLSGDIRFEILGPVNTCTWKGITRRHPTWFRPTKWDTKSVPLLAHTENIILSDFEVKLYSDNGLVSTDGNDNDIVYTSEAATGFLNPKDDLTMRFNSALTLEERRALGITDVPMLSTPVLAETSTPLITIHDMATDTDAKPEQLYVNEYWEEYSRPRVILEQAVDDLPAIVNPFFTYSHPALAPRRLLVQSISRNLVDATATLTLKEI